MVANLCDSNCDSGCTTGFKLRMIRTRVSDEGTHAVAGHCLTHGLLADLGVVGQHYDLLRGAGESAIGGGHQRAGRAQPSFRGESVS
jgi:hypothetical protein